MVMLFLIVKYDRLHSWKKSSQMVKMQQIIRNWEQGKKVWCINENHLKELVIFRLGIQESESTVTLFFGAEESPSISL